MHNVRLVKWGVHKKTRGPNPLHSYSGPSWRFLYGDGYAPPPWFPSREAAVAAAAALSTVNPVEFDVHELQPDVSPWEFPVKDWP